MIGFRKSTGFATPQGGHSLARSEGGLGIGLTVVKKLVKMHGGPIAAAIEG